MTTLRFQIGSQNKTNNLKNKERTDEGFYVCGQVRHVLPRNACLSRSFQFSKKGSARQLQFRDAQHERVSQQIVTRKVVKGGRQINKF